MKKVLSLLCAITMILSMMAFMTVSAAETASVTTEYVDLSGLSTKYHYVGVKVTYDIPTTLDGKSAYENDDEDMIYSGTALNGMYVEFSIDPAYTYMESKNVDVMSGLATNYSNGTMVVMFSPQTEEAYYAGPNKVVLGTFAFRVANDAVVAESPITVNPVGGLTYSTMTYSGVNSLTKTPASYTNSKGQISYNAGAIPAYPTATKVDTAVTFDTTGVKGFVANAVETAVDGTVTIDVTPAYGSKIASVVTTDGEAAYTANGGTITISGLTAETATVTITTAEDDALGVATFAATYVDGDTAYVFGKVPAASEEFGIDLDGEKYAAETATAEGVFGVAFIGLEAGSYTATAYAGETLAAAGATIVIAE